MPTFGLVLSLQIRQDVLAMIVQYLRSEKLFMAAVVIQDEANMKTAEQQVGCAVVDDEKVSTNQEHMKQQHQRGKTDEKQMMATRKQRLTG